MKAVHLLQTRFAVVLCAAGMMSACAAGNSNRTPPVPTLPANVTPESTPTSSADVETDSDVAPVIKADLELVDPDLGYTYHVELLFGGLVKPTSSIEEAPPGYADVSVGVEAGSLRLTNTTPGRVLPTSAASSFQMRAAFRDGGPVCAYFSGAAGMGDNPSNSIVLPDGQEYCVVKFTELYGIQGDLAAGATFEESSQGASARYTFRVAEAAVGQAITELSAPEFYLINTNRKYAQATECEIRPGGEGLPPILTTAPVVVTSCRDANWS